MRGTSSLSTTGDAVVHLKMNYFYRMKNTVRNSFSPREMWTELQYLFRMGKEEETLGVQSSSQ